MNSKESAGHRPMGVSDDMVDSWRQQGFALHYIPNIEVIGNENFGLSEANSRLLKETKPSKMSHFCPGRWVLVETAELKRARVPWINSADTRFLTLFGIEVKKWLQRHTQDRYHNDNLENLLARHGQYSRFCMDITEVKTILGEVPELLSLPDTAHVRLPHYVEYCHLCKNFYPEWAKSKTWEWLEDTKEDGQHLATGYGTWNIIGYDPADFWSTILGFRVIIEL